MTIPDAEHGPDDGARLELTPDGGARLELEAAGDALFELGQVVVTPGVLALIRLGVIYPALLLRRHTTGDWGGVGADGEWANNTALANGGRLVSVYGRIRVITQADRAVTTILLPGEA